VHEKTRRNMIAVNNQMHLVMLAVAVLRREGFPAYPGLSRADVQDVNTGEEFSTKIPIIVAMNPKLGKTTGNGNVIPFADIAEDGEPLALVTAMSRLFPDTEEIEVLSDHTLRSLALCQCALDRVQFALDRLEEGLGIEKDDDGRVSLDEKSLATIPAKYTTYKKLIAALNDVDFMEAVTEAGSDLFEAHQLWPEGRADSKDFFHLAEVMGLIGGTPDGSKGMVWAFCDVVRGMATRIAAGLPEIIMMKPEVARERIKAITAGAELVDATRIRFQEERDAAKAAEREEGDS